MQVSLPSPLPPLSDHIPRSVLRHSTPALITPLSLHQTTLISIRHSIPTQEAGNDWLRLGVTLKSVTLGNVTMSHRTREVPKPCVSLPLNYDRSAARSTRD
ncbi:hypothetical protein EVAR_43749_1 [Eumeta japonica]|uniref:Uncharacterized protein n=1 Tax=Eumeta variegata TaxID=151549 RepID=A0A4C1XZP8_EUMVA|nr:hypothetical protein EVAR_43749_1 [Eumeta japonica]